MKDDRKSVQGYEQEQKNLPDDPLGEWIALHRYNFRERVHVVNYKEVSDDEVIEDYESERV